MGCFFYEGGITGFPWFMCIIPVAFFLGIMVMVYWFMRKWRSSDCCNRETFELVAEVTQLRKELDDLKKKHG